MKEPLSFLLNLCDEVRKEKPVVMYLFLSSIPGLSSKVLNIRRNSLPQILHIPLIIIYFSLALFLHLMQYFSATGISDLIQFFGCLFCFWMLDSFNGVQQAVGALRIIYSVFH